MKGPSLQSNPQMPKEPGGQKNDAACHFNKEFSRAAVGKKLDTHTLHSSDYQFSIPLKNGPMYFKKNVGVIKANKGTR